MSDTSRSGGYVVDTTYTGNFFPELSPVWLGYVAALGAVRPPALDASFTYLDLGCGLATSTIVNAAAFPRGEFHACDLNPAHVAAARRHAEALGVDNVHLHETSFEELLHRDLPHFDFIVLHGVYSWVNEEERRRIRRIIGDRLKPGGLVYVSYNCLPGWANEVPLRRLLVELAATAVGDSGERVRRAVEILSEMSRSKIRYFADNAEITNAIEAYRRAPTSYLVHEFMNEAWEPFFSIDVADQMAEAGLRYLGSATLAYNHPELVIDGAAAQALARTPAPRQRELLLDVAVNRRFRRDVFVRGGERLSGSEATRNIAAAVVGCLGAPEELAPRVAVPRGDVRFQPDFVRELGALLAHGARSIGEIVGELGARGRNSAEIARNVMFLVASGALTPFAKRGGVDPALALRRGASPVIASPKIARALARVVAEGRPGAVPSEVVGNGVVLRPSDALSALEIAGVREPGALAAQHPPSTRERPTGDELDAVMTGRDLWPNVAGSTIDTLLPRLVRVGILA